MLKDKSSVLINNNQTRIRTSSLKSIFGDKLLIFSPHPDDESIGCAGTIARAKSEDIKIYIIWITSGDKGSNEKKFNPNKVAKLREAEAKKVAKFLKVDGIKFLRYKDSSLAMLDSSVTQELQELIKEINPTTVLCSHDDPFNPDHIATKNIVTESAMKSGVKYNLFAEYEVWNSIPDANLFIDISRYIKIKKEAISFYKTQLKMIRYDEGAISLNRFNGVMRRGSLYSEAFKITYASR
jgi:LmbE family N-acetylglucosaminyl deacetylase